MYRGGGRYLLYQHCLVHCWKLYPPPWYIIPKGTPPVHELGCVSLKGKRFRAAYSFFCSVFICTNELFCMCLIIWRPLGQTAAVFWSTTMYNRNKCQINVPKGGLTCKTKSKCTGTLGGGDPPPLKTGVMFIYCIRSLFCFVSTQYGI